MKDNRIMSVEIIYNNRPLEIDLPDNIAVDKFAPLATETPFSFDDFDKLWRTEKLGEKFDGKNILFVVNDGHRSTPTARILEWINHINPAVLEKATFLIACGTHETPGDAHYNFIFGDLYEKLQHQIHYHDCRAIESMNSIGTDQFGEEVFINKMLFEFEQAIFINSVEPHYFAGFTGGRKSFCPGLTNFETIERNHNLANSLECAPLRLKGNPMAEHLENILDMIDRSKIFSFQIVYDATKKIDSIFTGDLRQSFYDAVDRAMKMYSAKLDQPYDIVLMEVRPPLDKNLYQAQKALENCQMGVADKGLGIVVSACAEGIGSPHFFHMADYWDADKNCHKEGIKQFGSHKLSRVNAIGRRIKAGIHSELDDAAPKKVFYQPVRNIEEEIKSFVKDNKKYRLAVVYDAAHMVLTI